MSKKNRKTISSKNTKSSDRKIHHYWNFAFLFLNLIILAATSPLLVDRYYRPHVTYRIMDAEEVQGRIQLNWSAKNTGWKTATNIRVNIMTPNVKKTEVSVSERVFSQIRKDKKSLVSVDIPQLPKGETIDVSVSIPPQSYFTENGGHYCYFIASVTADNCEPEFVECVPFKFFTPVAFDKIQQ